jgi:ubiquinone/menaquinone biosynthesis C-methylase UbiE
MKKPESDIYDPEFISGMFDRMSKTYGLTNLISSFGFTSIWRHQCLNDLPKVKPQSIGYDLMSGMGESWGYIQNKIDNKSQIIALDISDEMNRKALIHLNRLRNKNIEIKKTNILNNDIPGNSADFIVSTFGIKTFNLTQQLKLASEIHRILKPGGAFALIEISKPKPILLKWMYMFYLKIMIPIIGKIFMGNSEDYKMLGKYCSEFENSQYFHSCLINLGANSTYKDYFFGCASGVYGTK